MTPHPRGLQGEFLEQVDEWGQRVLPGVGRGQRVGSGRVLAFIDRIDRFQRRHRLLAFPFAVFKRYGEDRGGWLGSLVAYYGFFSLFPLLVAFVTFATWVFGDRPELLQHILEAVWSRVPFVAAGLQSSVQQEVTSLSGNGWLTVVSILITVWAPSASSESCRTP